MNQSDANESNGGQKGGSNDGTHGSVNVKRGPKSRSPLILFYLNLRRKTVVDPLAFLAFLLSAIPPSYSFYWWITPAKLEIASPSRVAFIKEVFPLPNGKKEEVIRLAAVLQLHNSHPSAEASINDVAATLTVGPVKSSQEWVHFIKSNNDPKSPSELIITFDGNAAPFAVDPKKREAREIYFSPRQGDPSEPLKNAITFARLKELVEAGEIPLIEIRVDMDGDSRSFLLAPKAPLNIPKYLTQKTWTVQEVTLR